MAESTLLQTHRYEWVNVGQTTATLDISRWKGPTAYAFLVAGREWAGTGVTQQSLGFLYYISGIQNGAYQSCAPIFHGYDSNNVTISGDTLTIKFINILGGGYAIYPLFAF